jgi:hypothetical protein
MKIGIVATDCGAHIMQNCAESDCNTPQMEVGKVAMKTHIRLTCHMQIASVTDLQRSCNEAEY